MSLEAVSKAVQTPGRVLRFRTGAAMPSRLGSEQLKDEITAVLELVKNAYDADATSVRVEFRGLGESQALRIQDDGTGMNEDDLDTKWAWLATENKIREDRSPVYRRRRLGQKGVGRFAAEKLGRQLLLRTRASGARDVLEVRFDWDELEGDRELGDYEFPIRRKKQEAYEPDHGVRLEIRSLRITWTKARMQKLRLQLARLIDPETASTDFKILFVSPWEDLNGPLKNPLLGSETHEIAFELAADGMEQLTVRRGDAKEKSAAKLDPPKFGGLRGRLRYFGQGLAAADRGRGGDPDADWNVGVRLFRDGCRVRPYGEPGPEGDWLQIYRARYLKGSRFRLKPHYLEGTIHISKENNPNLRDTTSREGLDLNESYDALVEYVLAKIGQLSDLIREEETHQERSRMRDRYRKALDPLTSGLSQVRSDAYRSAVDSRDAEVPKGIRRVGILPSRNAHWECLECSDSWKVPLELVPTRCREFSVGRDGKPSMKPGCGSINVRLKKNVARDEGGTQRDASSLDDVMSGMPAWVSGIQLRPIIDWDMGENDDEAEVRPDRRELAINGRHPAFRACDALDGNETVEGTALESLRAVAGLSVHAINAAAQAWGKWHFRQSAKDFDVYLAKAAELKSACLASLASSSGELQ